MSAPLSGARGRFVPTLIDYEYSSTDCNVVAAVVVALSAIYAHRRCLSCKLTGDDHETAHRSGQSVCALVEADLVSCVDVGLSQKEEMERANVCRVDGVPTESTTMRSLLIG